MSGRDRLGIVSGNNPTLNFYQGSRVRFSVSAPGHPLFIKTVNSTGSGDQSSGVANNGADMGNIDWVVPDSGAYFYNCQFHSSMSGGVDIIDSPDPLFDKSSFIGSVPAPYLDYLNEAVDRWSAFVKFNPFVYDSILDNQPNFAGIRLLPAVSTDPGVPNGVTLYTNLTSNTIAACGVYGYFDLSSDPSSVGFNSSSFFIEINERWKNTLNEADWVNVLTHELGHALGIGEFWSSELASEGSVAPVNNFLSGSSYINARNGYREVINNGINYANIPLEDTGGNGTNGAHWENTFRSTSYNGAGGVAYPGVTDELMIGFINEGGLMIISQLSIGALLDFGYEEVNVGTNEGTLNIANSLSRAASAPLSTTLRFDNCCGRHSFSPVCNGKIAL